MTYLEAVTADRRLMILRALGETSGYGANVTLIQCFLDSGGHSVSSDMVASDVAWLAELGLVEVKDGAVKLTARGGDVATGRSSVPGVRKLRPGE